MLIRDYLHYAKGYYGTAATSDYVRIKPALKQLRDLYTDHDAADFGPVGYKAVRQTMIEAGLTRQGINSRMKKIIRAFKWAASEGKIPPTTFETLRLIPSLKSGRTEAPDTKPVIPVDDAIVDATLACLSPIVADMVRLQRLLGCRPGEVCNLIPNSFDLTEDVWVAELIEHKTARHGHTRKIFVGPKAQAIILPYLDRESDEHLFRPCDVVAHRRQKDAANRTTPLSCGNRPGKRSGGFRRGKFRKSPSEAYTTQTYRRAIHNACDRAFPAPYPLCQAPGESAAAWKRRLSDEQLKALKAWQSEHRWGPNRLRHSRGTEVRKTFGLEAAQVTLGHRNANVTQVYAERNEELGKRVAREAG
ncbi:MAG: site-specific integrase [Pirellulaceae bacterium]